MKWHCPNQKQESGIQSRKACTNIQTQPEEPENLNTAFIFNQQIQFTNLKSNYNHGNRNNYMYLLGSNCNRAGLSEMDTIQYCKEHFDLPEREIMEVVRSAYKHHAIEFAKFSNIAKTAKLQIASGDSQTPYKNINNHLQSSGNEEEWEEDFLKNTPTISEEVYEHLPEILKDALYQTAVKEMFFSQVP
ncbi:MAG: hypothetical protein IPO21_19345 [Bacteroidales bacterium]|nr:hypothetical protein [Bacteroidales bacterium]